MPWRYPDLWGPGCPGISPGVTSATHEIPGSQDLRTADPHYTQSMSSGGGQASTEGSVLLALCMYLMHSA